MFLGLGIFLLKIGIDKREDFLEMIGSFFIGFFGVLVVFLIVFQTINIVKIDSLKEEYNIYNEYLISIESETISSQERISIINNIQRVNRRILANRRLNDSWFIGTFYIYEYGELELFDFNDVPEVEYNIINK